MSSSSINYIYRYPFKSEITQSSKLSSSLLSLAPSLESTGELYFFRGKIKQPKLAADMLLVLSKIVGTHYFLPMPANLDPVVTSNDGVLRAEGFSACCGVYARCDFTSEFFDSEIIGRGTTNVDFNQAMRDALSKISDSDKLEFQVGKRDFSLKTNEQSIVEKKVKLPIRWIKGFCETQLYQTILTPKWQVTGPNALALLRKINKGSQPKQASYLTQVGQQLRLSQRQTSGSVKIHGLNRIKSLEPIMAQAETVDIWNDHESGVQAWVLNFEHVTFSIMLSPELYRGFSGEGQLLRTLAESNFMEGRDQLLKSVRTQLSWQNTINPAELAKITNVNEKHATELCALLGASGMAGYDITTHQYFHRQLPVNLDMIESLHPRMINARKLINQKRVVVKNYDGEFEADFLIAGTGVDHYVTIRVDLDRCTCPWFGKYQGMRGPCKHILAATLFFDTNKNN